MQLITSAQNHKGVHVTPVHTPFLDDGYISSYRPLLCQKKHRKPRELKRAAKVCEVFGINAAMDALCA